MRPFSNSCGFVFVVYVWWVWKDRYTLSSYGHLLIRWCVHSLVSSTIDLDLDPQIYFLHKQCKIHI